MISGSKWREESYLSVRGLNRVWTRFRTSQMSKTGTWTSGSVQDTSKPKPKLPVWFPVQTQFGSVPNWTSATLCYRKRRKTRNLRGLHPKTKVVWKVRRTPWTTSSGAQRSAEVLTHSMPCWEGIIQVGYSSFPDTFTHIPIFPIYHINSHIFNKDWYTYIPCLHQLSQFP